MMYKSKTNYKIISTGYEVNELLPQSNIKESDILLVKEFLKNTKQKYPFYELNKKRKWFEKYFSAIIEKEGWFIGIWDEMPHNKTYILSILLQIDAYSCYDDETDKTSIPLTEAFKLAKKYGWIINDDGIVLGLDKRKLKKFKHLISANELGLI